MTFEKHFVVLLVAVGILSDICCGLQNVVLTISPSVAQRGGDVTLSCHYNLAGSTLYTVKWYRGRLEFYRFSPKDKPSQKIFAFQGINVDISRSNESQVVLTDVGFSIAGSVSCEVTTEEDTTDGTAEGPGFRTANAINELTVVDLPRTKPSIKLNKKRYEPGDQLIANCSSSPSKPSVTLSFYVNNKPVPIRYQVRNEVTNVSPLLVVNLTLASSHFSEQQNALLLNCTASIDKLYWDYTNLSIPYRKEPIPERGEMSSSSRCWLILGKDLMKTYSVTCHRLINITKVGCNFKQSYHECAAKSHPQDGDGSNEQPEKKHRAAHAYVASRFHNKSAEEESPASIRLNRMIRKTLRIKVENYIESTLGKMVRADVDNFFDGKEKPVEEELVEIVHKICDLYMNKISDTCSMVQIMTDDVKELISSPVFAVGCLPLRSHSDLIEFDRKLRDEPGFRKSYVQYLRSLRTESAKSTIYTMIGVSVADSIVCMYCGQGKGNTPKLAFTDTELCEIILYEVAIMFPSVPSKTLKLFVSKKIFQTGLNARHRKGDMYAIAMEELKAIRKETCDDEEHDGEEHSCEK